MPSGAQDEDYTLRLCEGGQQVPPDWAATSGSEVSASVNVNALTLLRDLGDELRRLRMGTGFKTQELAAAKLKCSQNKVSYIETGKRWPDDDLLKKMFRVYGVDALKQAEIKATVLEAALRVVVGSPDVMREQLGHLRAAAQRPNITLRAVPLSAGAAATLGAPFQVYDFPGTDNRSIATRETSRSEGEADDPGRSGGPYAVRRSVAGAGDSSGEPVSHRSSRRVPRG
ncbi:Scr1 family TA system antitoxin-like transcriptional regulator [Streptomyces sp. NBC_01506]|uniref:helix-turn-helix domain-containing protein n=1 Tax=Streptomyces sp. NBC_01506 TaxID=2903887 RepID=UPI00386CEC95